MAKQPTECKKKELLAQLLAGFQSALRLNSLQIQRRQLLFF